MKKKLLFVFLCLFVAAICGTAIACDGDSKKPTEGLLYTYNSASDSYYVSAGEAGNVKHIVIPTTHEGKLITAIADMGFANCKAESIVLPSFITIIGRDAFRYCRNLTEITISSGVASIGEGAFFECNSMKSVYYNGDIGGWCGIDFRDSGYPWGSTDSGGDLYIGGSKVTEIAISRDIKEIKRYAFYKCNSITSVTIPASVTDIGEFAFGYCANLQTVTVADNSKLESIGRFAFDGCANLQTVTLADNSKLESVGDCAFSGCNKLTEITIPESVTYIGKSAFEYCPNLQPSKIENNVKYLGNSQNPYLYLWKESDKTITKFTIKEKTKIIGSNVFDGCSSLTSITIPAGVTTIGEHAFNECGSLTSITLPASVTSIDAWAFAYCGGLTSITIPQNVTHIGSMAFAYCNNLLRATFEEPRGWELVLWTGDSQYISSSALQEESRAAQYLRANYRDGGCCDYDWYRA